MARVMKWMAAGSFLLTLAFAGLLVCGQDWALAFSITFATCCYHFTMRLIVGYSVNGILHNKADYTKGWYQLRPFETAVHQAMQVKKWKSHMPTYDSSSFDPKLHSWEEIAQAMCQAEIVHEIIIPLSFLPLLAAIPFGAFPVFLITSLLSAIYDLSFVIMQRFNRPRVLKLIQKERAAK